MGQYPTKKARTSSKNTLRLEELLSPSQLGYQESPNKRPSGRTKRLASSTSPLPGCAAFTAATDAAHRAIKSKSKSLAIKGKKAYKTINWMLSKTIQTFKGNKICLVNENSAAARATKCTNVETKSTGKTTPRNQCAAESGYST